MPAPAGLGGGFMTSSLSIVVAGLAGLAAAGTGAGAASAVARRRPTFVRRAHLSRDDWAIDPLAGAMRGGPASFEVAIWLDNADRLQVGANRWDRDPGNAIGPRVLDRLAERAAEHNGRLFDRQRGSVTLMIEVVEMLASRRARAYEVLDGVLRRHASMLSSFRGGVVKPGPVTVVVTGEGAPRHLLAAQPERYAFIDGSFSDVGVWGAPANLVPVVSEHWSWRFGWDGLEEMPAQERYLLREMVAVAHQEGRRVRFFGLPERPLRVRDRFWGELVAAGVDLITTSDVKGLGRYLRRHSSLRETVTITQRVRDDRMHGSTGRAASAVGARH
jgi:hypothetical protein